MSSLNGVMKAIESLNQHQDSQNIDQPLRKDEKMSYCSAIVYGISCPSVRSARNFSQVLSLSIKTLLDVCADADADVRTVADECLNKIIRSISDGNILKVQFEFYNEIHRNGNCLSLRAALRHFGLLSHTIKPAKGKPYISNLVPCIEAISRRTEESLIETLSQSLPWILKSLGIFMTDRDVKTLLKAFYPNLSSPHAFFRRNAANMILTTCIYCPKPKISLFYVLRYLIDTLITISNVEEKSHLVVGSLICFRIMLPYIDDLYNDDSEFNTHEFDSLLQIYILCLRFIQWHSDHNVVNAGLETLAQLFRTNNQELLTLLTSSNGIPTGDSKVVSVQETIRLPSNDSTSNENVKDVNLSNSSELNYMNDTAETKTKLNIGSFNDSDVPLKYCCRYLASTFLLGGTPGKLVPDEVFRVSVKSLALTCIGAIVRLYPDIFFKRLEKKLNVNETDDQMVSDVLLYAEHCDPQLRGNVSMIVASLLNTVYIKYRVSYNEFRTRISQGREIEFHKLEYLIGIFAKALDDESAITCRQALVALNICLSSLLESPDSIQGITLIYRLLPLSDNLYFLVKMNLVQVLSELPYITINYLTSSSQFQEDVLSTFIKLLSDQDPRVRQAASDAIVKFVEVAYYKNPYEDEVIRKASYCTEQQYLSRVISANQMETPTYNVEYNFFVSGLIEPYYSFYLDKCCSPYRRKKVENSLSIVISLLVEKLPAHSSKYLAYGCFQTLCQLSQSYPTSLYSGAWDCKLPKILRKRNSILNSSNRTINNDNNIDISILDDPLSPISVKLLSLILSLVVSDPVSLDLATHRHLIILAGNLLSGISLKQIKTINVNDKKETVDNALKMWNLFDNIEINNYFELLFKHIMRLIQIYVHVINDIQIPSSYNKSTFASFPTIQSISPRKKLGVQVDHKLKDRSEKGPANSSKFGKESESYFYDTPHYVKLYDILQAAHLNYNSTIDTDASQMYLGLLNAALEVLSQILEISSTYEARKVAEEILRCLESTLSLSVTMTIQCVRQLLKSLFEMNFSVRWSEFEDIKSVDQLTKGSPEDIRRLYDRCFQKSSKQMAEFIKSIGNNCKDQCDVEKSRNSITKRKDSHHKLAMLFKSFTQSNNQKAFFATFIRIFEPMVIKSLNLYTTTNSVSCQCQVLSLLSQLVQFHVNYCLLDTDKTFINFVLSQFSFIEESKILQIDNLLPKIFTFFVHLSYEKFHTKMVIEIREIIKLCDGLMASGQPPATHCIPGLIPVVEDIFLTRSKFLTSATDHAELDTTREYLMSMMLRLVEHDKILELLARCLQKCRYNENGEEKWKKWSRMIIDAILPALSSGNIKVECESVMTALIKLFSVISPVVLRPVDPLLKIFFMAPPVIEDPLLKFERWLGRVNIIFLTLISYNKEENILTRLSELTASMKDFTDNLNLFDFPSIYSDISNPFDPTNTESRLLSPEEIFVLFILKVMSISAMKIYLIVNFVEYCDKFMKLQQNSCLFHELVFFIKLCIHIFESGTYCKITSAAMTMVKVKTICPVKQLNQFMLDVSKKHNPFLAIQWVQMMAILEYNEMSFWSKFLEIKSRDDSNSNNSIQRLNNDKIMSIDSKLSRQCTIILFCNYICENMNDESFSWLIINHIEEIIHLGNESPMSDYVTAVIQKNSEASKIFVQEISARCLYRSEPSFIKKLLQILDCVHENQSGEVVLTLLPFLSSSRITLAKMAAQISRKRIELLLSLNSGQVFEQLSREKFSGLINIFNSEKFIKKYKTLVNLVNMLAVKFYDVLPIKDHQNFDSQTCKQIPLDKKWFISQVRFRCSQASQPVEFSECAELLSNLSRENCDEIVMSEEFNLKVLRECIKLGVQITLKDYINNIVFIKGDNNIPEPKYGDQLYSECLSSLYLSTKECLFRHVQYINELIPNPHVVYNPNIEDNVKDEAIQYAIKFRALMEDKTYREKLFEIIPAVTMYMKSLRQFNDQDILCIDATFNQELVKFSTLCLEVINWMIQSKHESIDCFKPHYLDLCLNCSIKILQNQDICQIFGNANHYTWVCSAVNVLTKLVEFWHSPKKLFSSTSSYLSKQECLPKIDKGSLVAALENESTKVFADACLQMASLITWVEKTEFKNKEQVIPSFVKNSIITLVVIISRQELVNSFALTPPLVWKHGWHIQGSGVTMCHFPLLLSTTESNFLQEMNVLRQFVHRITLLGWTSRHQFEEIWMALLSVLSASSSENKLVNGIDDVANNEATILAVQGITRLLMQTLLLLYPGYPINSSIMHHTRDRPLSLKKTASKRLYVVQNLLSCQYEYMKEFNMSDCLFKDVTKPLDCEHLFTRGNIERDTVNNGYDYFSYSQLSIQYLWSSCSLHEDKLSASVLKLKDKRNQSLASNYLDLDSCVRFLIEFYSRWMLSYANTFPRLLNEVVKSIVAISELFVERNQFQWMFDTCWEMKQFHPIDDEILHHSLIFAICKAAAVLIPLDIESLEKIKHVIDQGLKLTYFPCQVATLHGILYLLQSAVQAKCEETINVIHPIAVNYIQNYVDAKQFNDITLNQCEQHQQIVWALIYFLHEHIKETTSDIESLAVLELASTLTSLPRIPVALHRTLVQGFERLIATRNVTGREADQIVKLSLERLKQPNILYAIPALRLLLTCMYTEAAGRINETTSSTNEQLLLNINPETLMMTIEKTSAIFDRIKRGYPGEVKILCYVLTEILEDFFPPFEILTKVISEFLSPQQPHQKLIASIVSKICERVASNVDQLTFFQDWVIFSLPNFIQSLPAQTFTWCLSCFFISASTNPWLRALFPYIQSRIGKDECEDRNILFISSLDFFQKLSNESQKEAFISCFSTADTELTSPFSEIVTSLQSISNYNLQ